MEGYMFKYHNQHQIVKDLIADGKLGEIRNIRSSFGFPPLPKDNFRFNYKLGGGSLMDAAGYTIQAGLMFLGDSARLEAASLNYDAETKVDIFGSAALVNDKGLMAQLSFGFDNHYQCNYEIWGSKGKLTAERAFTPKPDMKPSIILETGMEKIRVETEADNHFVNIFTEFARSVRESDTEKHLNDILKQSEILQAIRDRYPNPYE
jgi:NDP-hexose-3-ketoreductase